METLSFALEHCRASFSEAGEVGEVETCDIQSADTPATCGVAIEVPDISEYLLFLPPQTEDAQTLVICEPGARISTQLP